MGTNTKGYIAKEDLKHWDGRSGTFTRSTSSGGSATLTRIDYPGIDILHVYGDGSTGTDSTLNSALNAVGSTSNVTFYLQPGTWTLSADVTLTSNVWLSCPPGVTISVDSGKTFTAYSPENIIASPRQQIFSGSGSVAFTEPVGEGFSSWFATLEKAQESDIRHLIINADYSISAAVTFNQNDATIEFTNGAKISTTDATVDGLVITGNNCKVINPYMQGPGTFVQDNSSDAALIMITGDDCEVYGGRFVDPPTSAIFVDDGDRANIHHNLIDGGITSKTSTFHFGVKIEDSLGSSVTHNKIFDCVQGVKITSNTGTNNNSTVAYNYIKDCFDHAIYGGGGYENFGNNEIWHSQTGCGTAIVGQDGYGAYSSNNIYSIDGGISVRDCFGASVLGNIINIAATTAEIGISISRITDGDIQYTAISGNTIYFSSTGSAEGIKITPQGAGNTIDFCNVSENRIYNAVQTSGIASIALISSTGQGQGNHVENNIIDTSGEDGIQLQYMKLCRISGNTIKDATTRGIDLTDVSDSEISLNTISDDGSTTTNGIRETDASDTCDNNIYALNRFALSGLSGAKHSQTQTPKNYISDGAGQTWTLSGATNFYPFDGTVHFVDPDIGGPGFRDFIPAGNWPAGAKVSVYCQSGSAGEGVEFNDDAASRIDDGEVGTFIFDGTNWRTVSIQ